jgi:DNA-3-methyladenine glycosylase
MKETLPRRFYSRPSLVVARELVGKLLVRRLEDGQELTGIIVETEAYGGSRDPASHAYRGKTKRNEVMFGEAGHAYIYFTYGFHHCLNFVTGKSGIPSAVLIRAMEPTKGISVMEQFRKTSIPSELASGPGKLCQSLSIDRKLNGIDITTSRSPIRVINIGRRMVTRSSSRIGIRSGLERKWRFYAKENEHVSK